jgi:putative redox protein
MRIELKRIDDAFNMEAVSEDGNKALMDAGPNIGGKGNGVRPMQMLIMGLGGCSAIDVVMILKKQKQEIKDFKITIDAEREQGKEPALWTKAHLVFLITGAVELDKAQRAVDLSMEKYCSVSETLKRAGTAITYEVKVNQ